MAATNNDSCPWEGTISDDSVKGINEVNYNTGIIIVIVGMWVSSAIVLSKLFSIGSYRNLGNYILAATLRRSVPGIIYLLPYFNVIYSWQDFTFITCDFFGFWETIFAVFELESFTMVCIERYVHAKYVSKGWEIPSNHYYLYGSLCFFFAFMYAYPPLLGIGRYAKDFNCYHCTFDMILPKVGWKRLMVVTIFFMRSIKPAIMMLVMIYWARELESHIKQYKRQRNLTRGVKAALCINLVCGLPITLVRGTVVVSQLIFDEVVVPSAYVIVPAICIHWLAPLPALIALSSYDTFLYNMTSKLLYTDDPLDVIPNESQDVTTEESDNNDNDNEDDGNNDNRNNSNGNNDNTDNDRTD